MTQELRLAWERSRDAGPLVAFAPGGHMVPAQNAEAARRRLAEQAVAAVLVRESATVHGMDSHQGLTAEWSPRPSEELILQDLHESVRAEEGENNLAIDAQDEKFVEEALQEWVMTRARHQQEAMRRTPRGVGEHLRALLREAKPPSRDAERSQVPGESA
eukprot:g15774.t1